MDLAEYMSELSEQAYYAGWMHDLEYELWDAVVYGPRLYGHLEITEEHIRKLRELSNDCGGWIIWDEKSEETWMSIEDWKTNFQKWKNSK